MNPVVTIPMDHNDIIWAQRNICIMDIFRRQFDFMMQRCISDTDNGFPAMFTYQTPFGNNG